MSILRKLREQTKALNVKELAQLLRVTESTILRWVRKRQIPAIRVGDVIRFDPSVLADWIELQSVVSQRHQDYINRLIRQSDARGACDYQIRWEELGEDSESAAWRNPLAPAPSCRACRGATRTPSEPIHGAVGNVPSRHR